MTNPPHGTGDPRDGADGSDQDRHPTQPVPSFEKPPQPGPPYGRPSFGPPQYPPPRKSRVGLIAVVTGIVLLLGAGVVVLVMALQSTVLDRTAVERDVAAQFQTHEGVAVDLSCAEEMKVRSGATYDCTGTTADGEDVTLQIAITDQDSAVYTWTEP